MGEPIAQAAATTGDSYTVTHHHHPAADRTAWVDNTAPGLTADQAVEFITGQVARLGDELPVTVASPDDPAAPDAEDQAADTEGGETPLA